MKLIFDRDGASPVRPCELCLQPMRFLGRHEECLLFRCEDCVLVSTDARADTTASRNFANLTVCGSLLRCGLDRRPVILGRRSSAGWRPSSVSEASAGNNPEAGASSGGALFSGRWTRRTEPMCSRFERAVKVNEPFHSSPSALRPIHQLTDLAHPINFPQAIPMFTAQKQNRDSRCARFRL
jgi:hypothetical protein